MRREEERNCVRVGKDFILCANVFVKCCPSSSSILVYVWIRIEREERRVLRNEQFAMYSNENL